MLLPGDVLDPIPLYIRRRHHQVLHSSLLPKCFFYSEIQTRYEVDVDPPGSVDDCLFLRHSLPSLAHLVQLAIYGQWIYHQRGHDVQRSRLYRTDYRCNDPCDAAVCYLDAAAEGIEEVGYFGDFPFGWIVRPFSSLERGTMLKLSPSVCIASAFRIYYFTTTIVTVTQDFTCEFISSTPYYLPQINCLMLTHFQMTPTASSSGRA